MPRKLLFVAVASATLSAAVPHNDAQSRASDEWSYSNLDLDIRIDPDSGSIVVAGRARLRVVSERATALTLALNTRAQAMRFSSVSSSAAGATTKIVSDSASERAVVRFAKALSRGAEAEVRYAYRFVQPSSQLVVNDAIALASWVEAWYPIPFTNGDFGPWTAPGSTTFDLPRAWRAVSNGKLVSNQIGTDRRIERWTTSVAVNRSFSAAPYTVARNATEGRDIGVYLIRSDSVSARKHAETLARAITAMEKRFGPYPYATYAIAEIPDSVVTWSASSEQGFIMVTAAKFGSDGNLPLFAHEAAHGWWGNAVNSAGPGAQLMSESLAQYGAVLAIEAIEGKDAAADFLRFSRPGYHPLQCAHGYFYIWRQGGDVALARLANGRWDHNLSDSKGHWFYHMLRNRVGDEVFFDVLRGFIRDYAGKGLSLDTVRAAFVAASPRDTMLATFMHEWLDRTGAPVITYEWNATHSRADSVAISIRQHGELYHVPVELEILRRTSSPIRHRVMLGDSVVRITLPAQSPVGVRLDPDHKLLFWRPEYGPMPSPAIQPQER